MTLQHSTQIVTTRPRPTRGLTHLKDTSMTTDIDDFTREGGQISRQLLEEAGIEL